MITESGKLVAVRLTESFSGRTRPSQVRSSRLGKRCDTERRYQGALRRDLSVESCAQLLELRLNRVALRVLRSHARSFRAKL